MLPNYDTGGPSGQNPLREALQQAEHGLMGDERGDGVKVVRVTVVNPNDGIRRSLQKSGFAERPDGSWTKEYLLGES